MPNTDTTERVDGFICMVPNYWGWGATQEEAIKKCRQAARGNRSVAKGNRLIIRLPEGARDSYVDDMGYVRWTWAEGADKTLTTENVETPK